MNQDEGISYEEQEGSCLETEDCGKEKLPSFFRMLKYLFKDTSKLIRLLYRGKKPLVSKEIAQNRMNACKQCDSLIYTKLNRPRCSDCGCFMDIKVHIASSTCNKDKWEKQND